MGIMITYGSYVKPEVDLNKAVNQIEIFDTGVALLAGAMIIPAVYVFSGTEGMSAGPSLMFVSLPKVFNAMGKAGMFVGILFFVTAIFATLTSCISVLESITANCMEIFHSGRKRRCLCWRSFIWPLPPSLRWVTASSILKYSSPTDRWVSCWISWTMSATVL